MNISLQQHPRVVLAAAFFYSTEKNISHGIL